MKKFFHAVLVLPLALFAAACSDNDGDEAVKLESGTDTKQQVFADDTAPAPIRFTATASWTATVADTTPVQTKTETGRIDWLVLSAYEGGAGNVSLTMTLLPNYTGTDRKAEIRIACGGTTIKITVEQSATKKDGTKPEPEKTDLKNRIVRIEKYWFDETDKPGSIDEYYEFTYDETGRVAEIKWFEYDSSGYDDVEKNTTITYGDKTIAYESVQKEGTETSTSTGSIVLDENDCAVSGKSVETWEGDTYEYTDIYTLHYDADGYLVKCVEKESDNDHTHSYLLTWTDGNPTQVEWGYDDDTDRKTDWATYGTVPNTANLDLNWLCVLRTEGWAFSTGNGKAFFAAMGYTGKRSKNLAETVSDQNYDGQEVITSEYRYDFDSEGRVSKITETYTNSDVKIEYTITYTE